MKLEQLTDYEASEGERFEVFLGGLKGGGAGVYPGPERFRHPSEPFGKRAAGESIWPQLPMFGSFLVPLFPVPEADFQAVHKFSPADLAALVQLCKETGRIQFTLGARPTQFAGLDYLDAVLAELRPPVVRSLPNSAVFDQARLKKADDEFDTLASFSLWPLIRTSMAEAGLTRGHAEQNYETMRSVFSTLKLLGYHKTMDEVSDRIIAEAPAAHRLLYFYYQLVQGPMLDPLPGVFCFSREHLKQLKRLPGAPSDSPTDVFPTELGAFLQSSVVLAADGLDGAMAVADAYDRSGVPGLLKELNSAIARSEPDLTSSVSGRLAAALNDALGGAKEGQVKGVSHGIGLDVAAGGRAAASLLAASGDGAQRPGLLSGLGFQLADSAVESAGDGSYPSVSTSYAVSVYNFQKKHRFEKA